MPVIVLIQMITLITGAYIHKLIVCIDCTKWTATAGSYSTLGRFLSGYANVQSCLDACVGVYSDDVLLCEGVDIQLTPFACWFHIQNRTNVVITSEMSGVVNITQYWRNSTCTPEGKFRPTKMGFVGYFQRVRQKYWRISDQDL